MHTSIKEDRGAFIEKEIRMNMSLLCCGHTPAVNANHHRCTQAAKCKCSYCCAQYAQLLILTTSCDFI